MLSTTNNNNSLSLQEFSKHISAVPDCYRVNPDPSIVLPMNPMASSNNYNIPILNMATLTAQELHLACHEWGIFQLVNHGVSSLLVEKLRYEIQEFYKLPLEEKLKYQRRPGEIEGYGQTLLHNQDQKVDWADRFFMMINPVHIRKPYLLPELPSSLRETLEIYFKETEKVAMKLFELIAESLKIEKKEIMEEMFENGLQTTRMTYYPACPQPELVMGLTPHSDASGITLLLQVNGVDGLQVKKDGVWFPVNILPDALVVNVGDILEIISNGRFKSVEHRATVNSEKERISIAMFYEPKLEAEIGPSASLIKPGKPPLYKNVAMDKYVKDFFAQKLNGKSYLEVMKLDN